MRLIVSENEKRPHGLLRRGRVDFQSSVMTRNSCCRPCLAGGEAGIQPLLFTRVEDQRWCRPFGDVDQIVPADVSATQRGNARCPISGENPLLAVTIFKVAEILVTFGVINDRWIAASWDVMIADLQYWLGHRGRASLIREKEFCLHREIRYVLSPRSRLTTFDDSDDFDTNQANRMRLLNCSFVIAQKNPLIVLNYVMRQSSLRPRDLVRTGKLRALAFCIVQRRLHLKSVFVILVPWRPIIEDAGVPVPVVAPTARMNDRVVGQVGVGLARVSRQEVVGERMAWWNVVRMARRQTWPNMWR